MKTFSAVIVLAAVLVVPATAVAKPDASDKRAAIAQCKSERGKSKATRRAFRAKYHGFSQCTHQNAADEHVEKVAALKSARQECKAERKHGRNAFGKCVSRKAREFKHAQDEADKQDVAEFKNAAKECQSESDDDNFEATHDNKSFEDFYGTNHNHRNAFGKCVSSKAGEDHYVDPFDDDQGDDDQGDDDGTEHEHGHGHDEPNDD